MFRSNHENIYDLWANDGTGRDIFRATMSLKRFQFLVSCLRFDDKNTRILRKDDKLGYIRTVWNLFTDNCKKYYTLSENVTIDETLRAFKGRCGFKQYMPNKPNMVLKYS